MSKAGKQDPSVLVSDLARLEATGFDLGAVAALVVRIGDEHHAPDCRPAPTAADPVRTPLSLVAAHACGDCLGRTLASEPGGSSKNLGSLLKHSRMLANAVDEVASATPGSLTTGELVHLVRVARTSASRRLSQWGAPAQAWAETQLDRIVDVEADLTRRGPEVLRRWASEVLVPTTQVPTDFPDLTDLVATQNLERRALLAGDPRWALMRVNTRYLEIRLGRGADLLGDASTFWQEFSDHPLRAPGPGGTSTYVMAPLVVVRAIESVMRAGHMLSSTESLVLDAPPERAELEAVAALHDPLDRESPYHDLAAALAAARAL